ncbi:endonuclease/exonuclease/phosphatase [Microcoleus vaginatus PCC 9802]|uniref:endonuclease/exonuclease/phosphatase family protein n=1 Tax=Microcoleus vaginatus TaxID=119532 RepID=UPI00020D2C49|nr:Endonuclease/exonuclease/phosphatase [Microcoleus vaginatus FGP-2]UNU19817.1 endonuclease/exonuclease/phosphatase [Microcoleus vaginatus PCC 9802]
MDSIIRNIITIGLPTLILLIARVATGKTGDLATWSVLRKLGGSFGMLIGLCVLVFVGFVANSVSYFVVDSLLVRFYQKRRELEPPEQLVTEIDKLPITNDLKIKLKWAVMHSSHYKIISLKHVISKWFILAAIVGALLSIAGYLGQINILFELSSHFKLQYLLVGFSTFIFFALVRSKKIWLLVSAFCIIINLAEIVPWYFPVPAFAGATPGQHLRILHSNVLTSNRQYSEVISLVKAEQPDIAVFVEVSTVWAKELAVLSEMFPYSCHYQQSERFGSAIYSKLPLKNPSVKPFSKRRKSLFAEVEFQGKIISLILAHPTVPIKQQSFIDRNKQLAGIGEYAAQVKNPLIVVGDFNTTMWSPFYKNMVKTGNLRNARSGFGILPTWPTFMPLAYIPIDHFLVSKEIGVLKIRTGRNVGSDHLPLITDLVI